ncbi:MAG: hypothetical protein AUH85_03390 [Chloroflexi bacterium 13_1_40CM_4_68_4]|nr:MAG: hypothetical protein AUH85_03390 [Chloroflexi bacterium 13_1_40CM_4_68_4]
MARISYAGEGDAFRRVLNHSPELSAAYWSLRKVLNDGVVPARIRVLTFLASDLTNGCRY